MRGDVKKNILVLNQSNLGWKTPLEVI